MKYTRFEFRGQSSIGLKRIAKCLLLIPAIAIIIGFVLTRSLIVPNIQVANNEIAGEPPKFQNITPMKFYIVQGGVYSTRKNAETAASALEAAKIPAVISQDEKYFRITLYTGSNYEDIVKKTSGYKTSGIDYIVKETYINVKEVPENYKSDNMYILLSMAINDVGTAVNNIFDDTIKYEGNQMDFTAFSLNIREICKRLDDTYNTLNSVKDDNNKLLTQVKEGCQDVRNTINSMIDNKGALSGLEEKKFLCIQGYKDIIEHFNKSIH